MDKSCGIVQESLPEEANQRFKENLEKLLQSKDNIEKFHYAIEITTIFLEYNCWATAFDFANQNMLSKHIKVTVINNVENYLAEKIMSSVDSFNFQLLFDVMASPYPTETSKDFACKTFFKKIMQLEESRAINYISSFMIEIELPEKWKNAGIRLMAVLNKKMVQNASDYSDLKEKMKGISLAKTNLNFLGHYPMFEKKEEKLKN